jgi:hypothetical protein
MTSTIKAHNILTETFNVQLTYASTSNPYATGSINVAKDGYVPISASYTVTGTSGSTVFASDFRLRDDNMLEYAFRNSSGVSSTTQNRVAITVKYIRA